MAEMMNAARSSMEETILQTAWQLIYAYLDANRTKVFAKVGWKFIQFSITGDRLLEILTPLFGGTPQAPAPSTTP